MNTNSLTSYRWWELWFSKQCSWSFMPSVLWCCVVGQPAVPDIAKDHTAFIFKVKHFFLDYLTLTMKALHTIKMTGTITSPKDMNLFWNCLFHLATVIHIIIYGPLLNPAGFIWTVYYTKHQFSVSPNWSNFLLLLTRSIRWMFLTFTIHHYSRCQWRPCISIAQTSGSTQHCLWTSTSSNTRALTNGISRTTVIHQLQIKLWDASEK
jgi:hypothetical protein